jgi:uncharacterized membrane protein YfcA
LTLLLLVVVGVLGGALAAALGVGGGIVFVPALVVIAGFSQQVAEGTSLAVILVTTGVAAWTHHTRGRVDWRMVAVVGGAGIIGALAGSSLALRLHADVLQRLFAVLLFLVAVRMLFGLWSGDDDTDQR